MFLPRAGKVEEDVAQAIAAAATSATASAALADKLELWGVLDIPSPANPVCAYSARWASEMFAPVMIASNTFAVA